MNIIIVETNDNIINWSKANILKHKKSNIIVYAYPINKADTKELKKNKGMFRALILHDNNTDNIFTLSNLFIDSFELFNGQVILSNNTDTND